MGHEIRIGGVSLVVDDPRGQLARTAEAERKVEHQEAEVLEASVRTARNRPKAPVINTVDPIASLHARTELFDKVVNGRQGLASLALAWMLFGMPLTTFAVGIGFSLANDWHRLQGSLVWKLVATGMLAEIGILLGLGLLVRRTVRVFSARRCSATTRADEQSG
ncbi:hypothetical protein [Dyella amyloliquefaciens]|uniref:hypothetical protein n=1 Tax=Dyella amyloliquefaciens TaxID=1770545 RepID=UPI00102EC595|nr:hypothetical protein [Dyella amyloliquefaciens]